MNIPSYRLDCFSVLIYYRATSNLYKQPRSRLRNFVADINCELSDYAPHIPPPYHKSIVSAMFCGIKKPIELRVFFSSSLSSLSRRRKA